MKRDEASCFCFFLRCHSTGRRASLWWGLSKLNAELGYTDFEPSNSLNLKRLYPNIQYNQFVLKRS